MGELERSEQNELEWLRQRLLAEIKAAEDYFQEPLLPWSPDSGEISPMVRRFHKNDELIKLRDLYDRCFPNPQRILDTLRERYRERPLY